MAKKSDPKNVGSGHYGDAKIPVDLLELKAKTKDSDGKDTEFTYQYPHFPDSTKVDDVVRALAYTSKKEAISGESVLLDYVNTALKNAARSSKLAEINGILKLREDPEAAIKNMVDQMVLAYGVPREMAEANVRALIAQGTASQKPAEVPATT